MSVRIDFTERDRVPYLRQPTAALLASTRDDEHCGQFDEFLNGFQPEGLFSRGRDDYSAQAEDHSLCHFTDGLTQQAGQLCYMSFGNNRTPLKENAKYLQRIKDSGHGSVMEHANFTFLIYGIDRATTHELIRHRAGMAYSQVSQRYVDGSVLRFCMPFEYQGNEQLERMFMRDIENAKKKYERRTRLLSKLFPQQEGESKTDHRKRIQSCSRECLPNSTEAPIIVTGNARAWRHVISMRCSKHADIRIRRPMIEVLYRLHHLNLFNDFVIESLPDGTFAASSPTPKV